MIERFVCWMLWQVLDNRLLLGEAIGFAEVTRLHANPEKLRDQLGRNIRRLMEEGAPAALYRRHLALDPVVASVSFTLESSDGAWREPLPLTFPLIRWTHPSGMGLAFVPALGIFIVSEKAAKLDDRLIDDIRAALARGKRVTLPRLVGLQRSSKLHLARVPVSVHLRSARARAQLAEQGTQTSVLAQVATDVHVEPATPFVGRETLLAHLAELLSGRHPRSVLLVGDSGVGKTALFRALAVQRGKYQLGASRFYLTSGARLVAGMCGYGMWQERCQQVVREASRKGAVLHVGNLVELMSVGKSEHNRQGLAAFLRPYLARGDLLAVAECTPEQAALIEREDPHLFDTFHRLDVPAPDIGEGRAILRGAIGAAAISEEAIGTLDAVHRRYTTYSAYPGRPLRFLRNLIQDRAGAAALTSAHVLDAFTRETGLPRVLLDPAVPLDLPGTALWFRSRVVDQPEAVELIVDLLAGVKAWLSRPRRPIASLLFIGPTGVGKTEMAKALAEFLFGSRSRLTRFDMSEFGDPISVQRLVGDAFGSEGLLTAKVREQPFGVLLLDEFEKAHPRFLDLLLQVLGEGRLSDAAGRLADFSNTVVILTSNLGAESFGKAGFGFGDGAANADSARAHFTRAVEEHLRPELFNRIDRIVPFLPLSAEAMGRIAERHLGLLETRDGIRNRGALLRYATGVPRYLADKGFDVRYGARPLLRAIERELLAPLADAMNRYGADLAVSAAVNLVDNQLRVEVRPRTDAAGRTIQVGAADTGLLDAARTCVEHRRRIQAIEACAAMRELSNEIFQLERAEQQREKARRKHAARMARLANAPEEVRQRLAQSAPRQSAAEEAHLTRLREVAQRLDKLSAQVRAIEEVALHALYAGPGEPTLPASDILDAAAPIQRQSDDFLLALYCRRFPQPDAVTLAIFSEDRNALLELAEAYQAVAQLQPEHTCRFVTYRLPKGEAAPTPREEESPATAAAPPALRWRDDYLIAPGVGRAAEQGLLIRDWPVAGASLATAPPAHLIGIALRIRGPAAAPRFGSEIGLHTFVAAKQGKPAKCLVDISDVSLKDYLPPEGITRRGAIGSQEERRTYNRAQQSINDDLLKKRLPWTAGPIAPLLAGLLGELLQRRTLELLEE
jgi:ATP-dependent Clp protease ATP-binding subunit ClpA